MPDWWPQQVGDWVGLQELARDIELVVARDQARLQREAVDLDDPHLLERLRALDGTPARFIASVRNGDPGVFLGPNPEDRADPTVGAYLLARVNKRVG